MSSSNWNILGASTVAGTSPVSVAGSVSTLTINVQKAQAIAATDATKVGLAAFDNTDFSVDANGFVSFTGAGAAETLTGNSGGAVSPTLNNINIVGTGSLTIVGSPGTSTLTTQLTGLTNHAVLVGAGTATITNVGPTATAGQVLQSAGSSADPVFSTATYPATTTINQILYSSSNNVVGGISASIDGVLISSHTGIPSWLANSGTPGFILTANSGAPPSWQTASASGAITTITGNSGGAESPSAGNFNILGTGSITVAGSANTETVQLTGLTNHALQIGAGTATLTQLGAGTTGQVLQTNTTADPTWSTATYPSIATGTGTILRADGTNWVATTATYPATTTINQVLYSSSNNVVAGITAANNGTLISGTTGIPSWLSNGTTGQVLTATTGSPPSWGANAAFQSVNTQVFTGNGTYTPTSGMKYCIIEVMGGGGGGGGCSSTGGATVGASGGGGAGGYSRKTVTAATIGASQSVTVGAGGAAGGVGNTTGTTGGTTSVGAIISATGGVGGTFPDVGSAIVVSGSGGAGGIGSSGDFNIQGGAGGASFGALVGAVRAVYSGQGGNSVYGGGGISGCSSTDATQITGAAGNNYGSGGAGGMNTTNNGTGAAGGAGKAGLVVITEYI